VSIVKKYVFYKRCLITLFAMNVFFIVCGAVACVHYFRTHDVSALELTAVGLGTLVFGIMAPALLINKIMKAAQEMRRQTEQSVARWVAGWLEEVRDHGGESENTGEAMTNPAFWANIVLLTVEVFGQNVKHPAAQYFVEFAPMIREQLSKQAPMPKRRSRKRAKAEKTRRDTAA
jgi:predicted permease